MRRSLVLAAALAAGAVALVAIPAAASSDHGDKPCRNYSRACKIEVANTYMDAQAGGAGTREDMRLAPTAHRWENAILNATDGDTIRAASGFTNPLWSQRDRDRVWVDGNQVFSAWIVDIKDDTGAYVSTAHILERIQVDKGDVCGGLSPCVTEIEAIFCNSPVGFEPAMPGPVDPRPNGLCFRGDTPGLFAGGS
jgi:hypothetical protein